MFAFTSDIVVVNGSIIPYTILYEMIQYDMKWYNTIRYETIRHDTIQYNMIQHDTIRYDIIRYDITQYSTIWYNGIPYNTIQYDMIRYNMIRYNMIQYTFLSLLGNLSWTPTATHIFLPHRRINKYNNRNKHSPHVNRSSYPCKTQEHILHITHTAYDVFFLVGWHWPGSNGAHFRRRQGGPGGLQWVHQDHDPRHHPGRRLCQEVAHVLRGRLSRGCLCLFKSVDTKKHMCVFQSTISPRT